MTNHYEAPDLLEIGQADEVVLGSKIQDFEDVPPDPLPDASVIDVDE